MKMELRCKTEGPTGPVAVQPVAVDATVAGSYGFDIGP